MSCPEVVYQAYYPYLYQRPSTSTARPPHFPPFAHHPHYDRMVRSTSMGETVSSASSAASSSHDIKENAYHKMRLVEEAESSRSQCYVQRTSPSPASPHTHNRSLYGGSQDEDDEGSSGSRAQYVSANCVVFTHYTGDVEAVVDEHFTRALAQDTKPPQPSKGDWSPMSSRNFPPSFWNCGSSVSSESSYHEPPPVYHPCTNPTDPWHPHYQQYHHRAVHDYHGHNMQYGGGLLLPAHQYKDPAWPPQPHRIHDHPPPHHLDHAPYSPYTSISGLEGQVQETSKDLYWF